MSAPASGPAWVGPLFAVLGTLGFSFKAILVKLAYAWEPIDASTLLMLRMLYSAPFFIVMAWWAGRDAPPIARSDWKKLVWLGLVGYYLSSLFDFMGLRYITAALERLVLYLNPTLVVLLSALLYRTRITRRNVTALALSYAGIVFVFWHDLRAGGDARALATGGALVFASALCYAFYLVGAGDPVKRLGSMRFIAWAMLASTAMIGVHFLVSQPLAALAAPARIHGLSLAMAVFSTVIPTWMMAEALRRIGANSASIVGSLGPVFTIGLGAMILGESTHLIQLLGAALVLAGVLLVSIKARALAPPAGPDQQP